MFLPNRSSQVPFIFSTVSSQPSNGLVIRQFLLQTLQLCFGSLLAQLFLLLQFATCLSLCCCTSCLWPTFALLIHVQLRLPATTYSKPMCADICYCICYHSSIRFGLFHLVQSGFHFFVQFNYCYFDIFFIIQTGSYDFWTF